MKDTYVHAVLELLSKGEPVETVLTNLKKVLDARGHSKLHASILRSLTEKIQVTADKNLPHVTLAHEGSVTKSEIQNVLTKLDAPKGEYTVTYNPNIIGGVIATYQNKQLDQSYQTKLRELYQSIIAA